MIESIIKDSAAVFSYGDRTMSGRVLMDRIGDVLGSDGLPIIGLELPNDVFLVSVADPQVYVGGVLFSWTAYNEPAQCADDRDKSGFNVKMRLSFSALYPVDIEVFYRGYLWSVKCREFEQGVRELSARLLRLQDEKGFTYKYRVLS